MEQYCRIYLDFNATTPVRPEVIDAMRPYWRDNFANTASRHSAGQEAWNAVETAREQVAALVGCHPDDVIFTSGATEANYLALLGRFEAMTRKSKKSASFRVAVSAIEHPCVRACADEMARRGAVVQTIPVTSEGLVDYTFFDKNNKWDIVSVMTANHETGAIQPLAEIAARLDRRTTFFHTDAAQWAGRCSGDMMEWGVTAVSLSAHKMYGPKGVGALILNRSVPIIPMFAGPQEGGYRGGTSNLPGIVGFGAAAELAKQEMNKEFNRLSDLRERLWNHLMDTGIDVVRTIPPDHCLPNTLHVRFPGLKGERVVDALDRLGICCASGPACTSGASEPSPVLMAMGLSEEEAWEGVRFSLGKDNIPIEINEAGYRINRWVRENASRVA